MANVAHTQKYDIATKIGHNRPQKSIKLIVGDLECHDVACQVLQHLVLLIPTLEKLEETRIAGKGDKVQIILFVRVFYTKRTQTSAFSMNTLPDFGLITSRMR